jgi:hypothetical protein
MLLALSVLAAATAKAADCAQRYGLGEVEAALAEAEAAYMAKDREGVHAKVMTAMERLACANEAVGPSAAARVHRAVGLDAFLSRDDARAREAFAAAKAVEPTYQLSPVLAPEGGALRTTYGAASAGTGTTTLAPAEGVKVRVDGTSTNTRPTERPAVIQAFDGSNRVLDGGWYRGADAITLPSAPVVAAVGPAPGPPKPKGPNRPFLYAAIGSAVAGGAMYAAAWAENDAYTGSVPETESDASIRAANNGLTVGAGIAGGAAVVTGVIAVVTGSW